MTDQDKRTLREQLERLTILLGVYCVLPSRTDDVIEVDGWYRDRHRSALQVVREVAAALTKPTKDGSNLLDAVEMAWVIIANVSGGDLTMQSQDWQGAVRRWADEWLPVLGKGLQARTLAIPAEGREVEP